MGGAARRWARQLAGWGIPDEILARAPESPWTFDVGLFSRIADRGDRRDGPSGERAREALHDGSSVLDVGCGAGAASLALIPPAGHLVGVDPSAGMLAAFATRAEAAGATHQEVEGSWPDVPESVPEADVVVCHDVLYGVADLAPFVAALGEHARRRVVVEITAEHPLAWTTPYWRELHGIERPLGPTSEDAAEAIRELGLPVHLEHGERRRQTGGWAPELVPYLRRRLCLTDDRDQEIAELVQRHRCPDVRKISTLWWDVAPRLP